jgi:putative flippase GtrA
VTPLAGRWLKFNFVGLVGIGVQLAMLALLVSGCGLNKLLATGLAVETAVLHNFVWHELFTWRGTVLRERRAIALRLVRFHLGNGLVSIAGNVALMALLAGALHIQYLIANVLSIGACALLNFVVSEWFVFRPGPNC